MLFRLRQHGSTLKRIAAPAALLSFICLFINVSAETTRTQSIQLSEGWNAVFLSVEPADSSPAAIFANTPVDVVASYLRPGLPAQYVSNPDVDMFRETGWNVWYAASRPDSFLSDLYAINAPAALLVHSREAKTLNITGEAVNLDVKWKPNNFSFVGYDLIPGEEPTFAQFFAGSSAHQHNRFYRLDEGIWKQILKPETTLMRDGEAFWAFSEGASNYQGPLTVKAPSARGLIVSDSTVSLELHNELPNPITPGVEHVTSGQGPAVSVRVQVLGDTAQPIRQISQPLGSGTWTLNLPSIEAGAAIAIPFEAQPEQTTQAIQGSLLRITTDLGTEKWIPLVTIRDDLLTSP